MRRDTIAIDHPTALMWPRRVGVAPFAWKRVAAVIAATGFVFYLMGLSLLPGSR